MKDNSWIKKAKHRCKYDWFYNPLFIIRVKIITNKKRILAFLQNY